MCVSYEGKFDVARKIKVDGAKGGGQKPDGNKGKGKNATTEAGGIYAASVLSGDGFYLDGDKITAGTIGIGEVTIDSGVYTIDRLYSGRAYYGYVPTYGTVTITDAATSVTVDEGTPGSTGAIRVGYYNPGGTGFLKSTFSRCSTDLKRYRASIICDAPRCFAEGACRMSACRSPHRAGAQS